MLVRVRACGVCYRDVLDRKGKFPFLQLPIVPGHEFAGEVASLGGGAKLFAEGDRVVNLHRNPCGACRACRGGDEVHCTNAWVNYGLTADGGYAEYVRAPESSLVALPREVPFEEGATLMCTTGTALRALRTKGRVGLGERVLVTGASGGVGLQAIQVAKLAGASVVAVTGSPAKAAALREAGADEVLVDREGGFHKEVLDRWGGVDLGVEITGRPTFNATLRSLKPGGRLVLVGNLLAERVEVNPGLLILKGLTITGSDSSTRSDLEDAVRLAAEGKIRVTVADRLPLDRASEAHRRLEERGVIGRLVLVP